MNYRKPCDLRPCANARRRTAGDIRTIQAPEGHGYASAQTRRCSSLNVTLMQNISPYGSDIDHMRGHSVMRPPCPSTMAVFDEVKKCAFLQA
jgi:hypothetical protein